MAKMMYLLRQRTEWTFLLLMYVSAGASELICPSAGYLGSPVNLTCILPNNITSYGYTTSPGAPAAICNVSAASCTSLGDYRASVINQTHSLLTLPEVQPAHAGEWRCHMSSCNLLIVKLPVCSMTQHVADPDIEAEVSLRVNIKGYYCSELTQLKISSGDSLTEYPNETVTDITDQEVSFNTTDANTEREVIFTCGDNTWNISCNLDNREKSTVPRSNQTSPSPPVKKIPHNYIVIGVVVIATTTTIIMIAYLRKRNMTRKAPPVLQCPDPPYVEVKQVCNNTYASVEDLSLQGRAPMEHSSTTAYAETGFYEAVGDKSAPKTGNDDSHVLMEAGGYSMVAAGNAEKVNTQDPSDTGNYETVGNKTPRESGEILGVQPVVFDIAGYSTVKDFSPRPSDGSLGHMDKEETVSDLEESRKTNRLCELYAKVNKKKGAPGLANSEVTPTSGM